MSDMIERVAWALSQGDTPSDLHRRLASAAIEAMREPTKKMLDAAQGSDGSFERSPAIRKVAELYWQNMIDAALTSPLRREHQ